MKQKFIYICMLFAGFTFFSCSQDEEIFSCDKEINAWVKENLTEIRQMDRSGWLQLNENLKRGAYVAFGLEQKQTFWLQKMQEVLSLDWTEREIEHIQILYQTILDNPNWFSKNRTEKEFEEYDLFQYQWVEYAQDNLKWDMELIGSIVASGNKLLDTTGKIEINVNSSVRLKSGNEMPCECNQMSNWCGPRYACTNSLCDDSWIGCGTLWISPCNGLCKQMW